MPPDLGAVAHYRHKLLKLNVRQAPPVYLLVRLQALSIRVEMSVLAILNAALAPLNPDTDLTLLVLADRTHLAVVAMMPGRLEMPVSGIAFRGNARQSILQTTYPAGTIDIFLAVVMIGVRGRRSEMTDEMGPETDAWIGILATVDLWVTFSTSDQTKEPC